MIKPFAAAFAAAIFFAGAAVTPPPSPVPSPSVSPLPSSTPVPSASPSASPTPAALPTPLVLPPDAPPQILAIQTSASVVHGGDTFSAAVITSTNVAAVEIRLAGHARRLTRGGAGVWQIAYVVPNVPFWMRRTYTADVVAINSAGVEATKPISVALR